jgi:PhnB protein
MYIPPGFGTVTPYFFVDDAERFIAFLCEAFGGNEVLRSAHDGRIANAQIVIGTSTVMVSDTTAQYPAMPTSSYLYVEGADATVRRALAAGAEQIMEVADMPYGDRQGGVRDAWGNLWWISQRLVEAPYSV